MPQKSDDWPSCSPARSGALMLTLPCGQVNNAGPPRPRIGGLSNYADTGCPAEIAGDEVAMLASGTAQNGVETSGEPLPAFELFTERAPAGGGEPVVSGAAIVIGRAPVAG